MSVANAYTRLTEHLQGSVLSDERMLRHTTYRIGGPAALYVTCDSFSDLHNAVDILGEEGVPWVIMGRGSNVLVADKGYRGCVLTLGKEFRRFSFDDDHRLHAGAGAVLQRLVTEAFDRSLAGLEFTVGIPGTLGGAISMDAGTAEVWIGSRVDEVIVYRPGEGLVRYAGSDIAWMYRATTIPSSEIVLEATLRLTPGNEGVVKQTMESVLARRKETQPIDALCCGSVFRNPTGTKAAQLIEGCGLKGYTVGQAQVSERHANFIINLGGATAADVTAIIAHIIDQVKEHYDIELRPEVKFLGFSV